jgi:hypothetical protein
LRQRLLFTLFTVLVSVPVAHAQYFGRNKVRYTPFEFHVLKTDHFDVHYYASEEEAARIAARLAERWYERLKTVLGHDLSARQPIILYAGHPDFEQTNVIGGEIDEGTGGVTETLKRRVVLPFAGPLRETDHVLGHELVHAFQFDIFRKAHKSAMGLPLWFAEGMAEYLSLGPVDPHTAMWMRDAALSGRLPALRELDDPRYFPYRYGQAFWAYVAGRYGDEAVGRVLKASTRSSRGPIRVLEKTLGVSEPDLSRDWRRATRAAGEVLPGRDLTASGRTLVSGDKAGPLNLGPALSPDGRRLVFLSARGGNGLDLFLADAETGRVERRLLKQSIDPHFESLQFIHSSGAWDATGRLFAIAAVRQGRPVLSVLDVETGKIEREISLPSLVEVLNPTWSPDGGRIAFAAIHGGLTDLYVYDLASDRLSPLTSDAFADLHPAWSPDGRSIAFVTDRFTTHLDRLEWGDYRLARLDLASGRIEPLPCFEDAKNINPQWGAGGRALYFLSDRGGTSNVYRLEVASGALRQVTEAAGGVSGLTDISPALASSSTGGRLVVSAFAGGHYHLHAIEDACVLEGRTVAEHAVTAPLPPGDRKGTLLADLLRDPDRGRPDTAAVADVPYRARMSAGRISDPYMSVGSDRFGLFVAGGASLSWSDMLGNSNLYAAMDMKGGPKDLTGVLAYQNRRGRWIWGGAAEQRTFSRGSLSSGLAEDDGRTVSLEQSVRYRETDRHLTAMAGYPFSRSRRLELTLGVRQVSFSNEIDTRAFSLETGERLRQNKGELPAPDSLLLGEIGAALVHDSTRFGATSPIRGARYRLELTPTLGSRVFTSVLVDARRYVMPVRPFTLAARVLHYGRYGRDADDMSPMFVGYPSLVRGYDVAAFGGGPCPAGGCPRIDGLVGSKLLAANVELRLPAFAWLSRDRPYGPLPAELALFFDAGTAWKGGELPRLLGGQRGDFKSWGAALRVNLFGFAIAELDYIRPLDLPGKDTIWRVRLSPGF